MEDINSYAARSGRIIREDGTVVNEADGIQPDGSRLVQLTGSILQEQLTELDADNGILTFSEPIKYIEIYNTDESNPGVFTVNGIAITVPQGKVFNSAVGGTPSAQVSVTGAMTYIVSRYV